MHTDYNPLIYTLHMQNGGTRNIYIRCVTVLSVNLIIVDLVELETSTW